MVLKIEPGNSAAKEELASLKEVSVDQGRSSQEHSTNAREDRSLANAKTKIEQQRPK
jgi:hypothetical protein